MAKHEERYATARIIAAVEQDKHFARQLGEAIVMYSLRDWGDLCESDKALNDQALQIGGRILAAYNTSLGRVYIITDDTTAVTLVTTVLFADEY